MTESQGTSRVSFAAFNPTIELSFTVAEPTFSLQFLEKAKSRLTPGSRTKLELLQCYLKPGEAQLFC
jgi:hypothetical protein